MQFYLRNVTDKYNQALLCAALLDSRVKMNLWVAAYAPQW